MSEEKGSGSFFIGFLIGGLFGAALALLLTPRTGEETREQIREKGLELRSRADAATERARSGVASTVDQGRDAVGGQRSRLQQAISEGREAAEKTRQDLMGRYEQSKQQGHVPEEPA